MNEITLPASPNWYLSSIISCTGDGTVAWGARNSIVVAKKKENSRGLDYSILDKAHTERVVSVAFSPWDEENSCYYLVSVADNNVINVWDMTTKSIKKKFNNLDAGSKIAAVDWSKHNPHLICYITHDGILGTINMNNNSMQNFPISPNGKMSSTCLACCPHDSNLVAVGGKNGLVYIVNVRGYVKYKLRGHDTEITSLSWCPAPHNIFDNSDNKDLLLASGAKDKSIFLWKAGSNGRSQTYFTLPNIPLDTSKHRSRLSFTALCWLTPKILFSNSPWGELLLWDLSEYSKKKFSPTLIHGQHSNGLFAITGFSEQPTEKLEETDEESWRAKAAIKSIWTVAQDRQVVCCSHLEGSTSIEHVIPTQGGFVYCLSACPIDTSLIAFGVGDYMIRLWNLSEPHENVVEVQMLWEKIKGKVRSLSWHPEKENILAFGTDEGRVGLFDTNTKKPPVLTKQFFKQTIYTLAWGPVPEVEEYALYAVSEGELVYFDPKSLNSDPKAVIEKNCTEFSWKPDYSILAVGFNNGSISFFDRNLTKKHTIHYLSKAIQCLTWHPESTMSDLNISPMQNYLAAAINDISITIFEILNTSDKSEEENPNESQPLYRTVATLNGHSDKVVGISWSPHMSGYLVSCSYDCTAQVWNVEAQEIIATYKSHVGPIQCCLWSPLSQDLIITGSADFTLRIWNISNQTALPASESKPKNTKSKRTKKKKTKALAVENNSIKESEVQLEVASNGVISIDDSKEYVENHEQDVEKGHDATYLKTKKKKQKKTTLFPGYAEIANNSKIWCDSIRKLLNSVKHNEKCNGTTDVECNDVSNGVLKEDEAVTSNNEVPPLLGTKKDLEDALNLEKKILYTNKQYNSIIEIDQWTNGNLKDSLSEALKNSKLTDFSVSLAASVSKEFWEKVCEAYASQLVFEENPQKAASYLLCIDKVAQAIDVLRTAKLYRPAYILATSKLDSTDPVIKNILNEWANNAQKVGNFRSAVECFIKLGEYSTAAKLLERCKDLNSLVLATEVAKLVNDPELSVILSEKALIQALMDSNIDSAKLILKKNPQIQYREVEVDVFDELSNILEKVNDDSILKWIIGLSDISLLNMMSNRFNECPKKYLSLLQKDITPLPVSQKMILINVSHQLALATLSDKQNQKLQHIVRALAFISQHENTGSDAKEEKYPSLINYIYALDSRSLKDPNSIFNSEKSDITISLRAYLCHALIQWFNTYILNEDQKSEYIDYILLIFKNYMHDLFNKESVKFWTTANEIRKLESELSVEMNKLKNSEGDEIDKSRVLIEHLDQLRNAKNHFLNNRVSSPNPMFSYGVVNEFISKIINEDIRKETSKLVLDMWTKAIS